MTNIKMGLTIEEAAEIPNNAAMTLNAKTKTAPQGLLLRRKKMCVSRKFYSLSKRKDCEKSYPSIVFRSSSGVVIGAML